MLDWVSQHGEIPRTTSLSEDSFKWIKSVCELEGWKMPTMFSFHPINCNALIYHWRVLAVLLNQLTAEERQEFHRLDARKDPSTASDSEPDMMDLQVVDETGFEEPYIQDPNIVLATVPDISVSVDMPHPNPDEIIEERANDFMDLQVVDETGFEESYIQDPNIAQATVPDISVNVDMPRPNPTEIIEERVNVAESTLLTGIDSHFHLDRSARLLKEQLKNPRDLIQRRVGPAPPFPINIIGGVSIYCDPEHYPESFPSSSPGFKCGVGVHPRKVEYLTAQKEEQLRFLLNNPAVTALGEVGIDRSEPKETWELQERIFTHLLMYNQSWRPCVIHIRDPKDEHSGELYSRCLDIMKANSAPTQRIHLHCFTGTTEQVLSWSRAFPNCSFGFTAKARRFDKFQEEAVRHVPDNRLLLETDSPYLSPVPGLRINTPSYLGSVADAVARIRGQSIRQVLEVSTMNARMLYWLE